MVEKALHDPEKYRDLREFAHWWGLFRVIRNCPAQWLCWTRPLLPGKGFVKVSPYVTLAELDR